MLVWCSVGFCLQPRVLLENDTRSQNLYHIPVDYNIYVDHFGFRLKTQTYLKGYKIWLLTTSKTYKTSCTIFCGVSVLVYFLILVSTNVGYIMLSSREFRMEIVIIKSFVPLSSYCCVFLCSLLCYCTCIIIYLYPFGCLHLSFSSFMDSLTIKDKNHNF